MAETRTSLAVVLRWRPFGESDKIATLLTADFGKLTGIAKGAQRSRRRFANSLEPLAGVRVYFRQRPQASLAFLESCDLVRPVGNLSEPAKLAYGGYLAELVDQLTPVDQPVGEVYALLDEGLTELQRGPATNGFLRGFEVQLLSRVGYEPQLEHCGGCRAALDGPAPLHLSLVHGTFWCERCRAQGGAVVAVAGEALSALQALKRLPLAECRSRTLAPDPPGAAEITGRLLGLYIARPLRSTRLIAQLAG